MDQQQAHSAGNGADLHPFPAPGAAMVEFALDYARRGWPVFPCRPTNKAPFFEGGFHRATTDEETIRKWWGYWPKAMIGVPMGSRSGVWAIDPDPPKKPEEPDGREMLAKLVAEHGELPATHTENTPRSGQHIAFKWDPDRPVSNSPGALARTNIDVRGEGGYIVVAPSVCDGDGSAKNVAGQYCVAANFFQFANAPDWLYDMVLAKPEPKPESAPMFEQATVSCQGSGDGNGQGHGKGNGFFRSVNDAALANLSAWVPSIFGNAKYQPGTGAYRVSSKDLGRELEEDLSIAPGGIKDWGVHGLGDSRCGGRTAIDLVIEHGGAPNAVKAALWLCERIGIAPAALGWNDGELDLDETFDNLRSKAAGPAPGGAGPSANAGARAGPQPFEVFWHGTKYDRDMRSWAVADLLPETGQGLLSGQWGTAKTFAALDLGAAIAVGLPFAGREVIKRGGVLFVAAEGASEIAIRLEAVVEQKLRLEVIANEILNRAPVDLSALPFGWIEDCPNLQDNASFARLMETIKQVAADIRARFDLPLVLIVIDTLSAAGNFRDANDAAEGQIVMNRLGEISRQTGAFALAIDHFGKMVETGTRGSSAKEAAADVVLALLADREIGGALSNTRMALRKLRGGKVGTETSFKLRVVDMGEGRTTCVIEWKAEENSAAREASEAPLERWPKSLRIFKQALETTIIEHGKAMRPYGSEGPEVRAAAYEDVRTEFKAAYPAEGEAKDKGDTKRKAFARALKQARTSELIGSREIGGIDYLWLARADTD